MAIYKSKIVTKDGRQYFFRIKYKDIFGVTHDYSSAKFKLRNEAVKAETEFKLKVQNKQAYSSAITIDQIFCEFMSKKEKEVKRQTAIKIRNMYEHFDIIKNKKINELTIYDLNKFKTYIENKNFSVGYSNKILNLLSQIIQYSSKYYNTSNTIVKYIEKFKNNNENIKEMKFFTYDDYLKFDSVISNFDFHVFFEILYFMGLRQGEAQALTWKDIDLQNGKLSITKTLTTKIKGEKWTISVPKTKNSVRVLPLTEKLLNDLNTMLEEAKKYKDFSNNWFIFGKIKPFPETTIQVHKNKYCKLAKVEQIRIHDFRHSCASLLINKGASVALVSKWLGHANITITMNVYVHLFKNELDIIANQLSNL